MIIPKPCTYEENGEIKILPEIYLRNIFNNINVMLSELAERFKYSKYIHIGCDEVKHEKWKTCPDCREFMAKNGISDTKKMYSMFVGRIAQAVLDLGKTPIVWEGFPKEGSRFIPRETVVVSWENYYKYSYGGRQNMERS